MFKTTTLIAAIFICLLACIVSPAYAQPQPDKCIVCVLKDGTGYGPNACYSDRATEEDEYWTCEHEEAICEFVEEGTYKEIDSGWCK